MLNPGQIALSICPKHWAKCPIDIDKLPTRVEIGDKAGEWFKDVLKCTFNVTPPEIRGTSVENLEFIQCGICIAGPKAEVDDGA